MPQTASSCKQNDDRYVEDDFSRRMSLGGRTRNCFAHFFSRYMNHESSRLMEEPLLHSAKRKREILQSAMEADAMRAENKGTRFYEDGVWELLKARSQQPKCLSSTLGGV